MDGGELERREWDDAIRNPSRSMDGLGLQCSCLVEWSSYEPLSSRPRWECCSSSLCPVSPWRYQQSYPQPVSCPPTNMHCAGVLEVGKNVESILYLDGSFIILTRWTQGLFAGGKRKAKNSQLFPSNETPFFLDFVIQKFSNLVFNKKKLFLSHSGLSFRPCLQCIEECEQVHTSSVQISTLSSLGDPCFLLMAMSLDSLLGSAE